MFLLNFLFVYCTIVTSGVNADKRYFQIDAITNNLLNIRSGADVLSSNKQVTSQDVYSSDNKSPYDYVPVTALDDYGESTQLRNAMESTSRYGTPVLACLCKTNEDNGKENAVIVCSLQRPRLGIISSSHEANDMVRYRNKGGIHPSIQGMVKILTTRDDSTVKPSDAAATPKHSLHTALISTGLQSDTTFLLNKLQSHCISKYWLRYDTLPQGEVITRMVREILLDFLGYDWSEEVGSSSLTGGIGSAAPSYNDNEEESTRAGRPLGVCTFLIGFDEASLDTSPSLTVIKADGSSDNYVAYAMGIGAELSVDRLSQKWRRGMNSDHAKDMMRDLMREVAVEKGWLSEDVTNDKNTNDIIIVCETVSQHGIDIDYITLK